MKGTELLDGKQWKLSWLGLDHPFFTIDATTVINTWIVLLLLLGISLFLRRFLLRKTSIVYLGISWFITVFLDLCNQTLGTYTTFSHFAFITTLFIFILTCNIIIVIPWLEEPTKNIHTTLALGIISFMYTQYHGIKAHGIKEYIKEYLTPIFIMFPLHILGKLASIISISFRLFGNIFGGAIISHLYLSVIEGTLLWEILGIISGANFIILLFFGFFEGFLQAFVFTMLTVTYLSIALQGTAEE